MSVPRCPLGLQKRKKKRRGACNCLFLFICQSPAALPEVILRIHEDHTQVSYLYGLSCTVHIRCLQVAQLLAAGAAVCKQLTAEQQRRSTVKADLLDDKKRRSGCSAASQNGLECITGDRRW
jgi:hypothetical protein